MLGEKTKQKKKKNKEADSQNTKQLDKVKVQPHNPSWLETLLGAPLLQYFRVRK